METNFQHYEKEILEISKQDDFIALVNNVPQKCKGTSCRECYFGKMTGSNCNINRILWGYRKYSPPVKLSCLEYEILKALETDGWFYIARDLDGSLFAYNFEPYKKDDIWDNDGDNYEIVLFKKEFKFVDWLDEKPVDIEEILNNCEVIRNERI